MIEQVEEKPGLVDYVLLPLKWLERSRGWTRRGLVLLYFLIFAIACLLGYRELHLWRLPYIREPFDEAKYGTVKIADSDNAAPLYLEARKRVKPASLALSQIPFKQWNFNDWDKLDPLLQRYLIDNQPALEVWRKGTERPDCLFHQPDQLKFDTSMDSIAALRDLARLGLFDAARLTGKGDLAGGWELYRAVLRSSRHVGLHGGVTQRIISNVILSDATAPIKSWTDNPGQTSALLKRAIRDVEACQAMTPSVSEMVRVEYFINRDGINRMDQLPRSDVNGPEGNAQWYVHVPGFVPFRRFLVREPERSHRVHRLLVAGELAQCDRPRWARPPLMSKKYMIHEIDAKTPPAVASITPESLEAWVESSVYSTLAQSIYSYVLPRLETEPATFDTLRLRMAERAFELDHGNQPAKTYGELLGGYLKDLPEGIEPGDLATAPK